MSPWRADKPMLWRLDEMVGQVFVSPTGQGRQQAALWPDSEAVKPIQTMP